MTRKVSLKQRISIKELCERLWEIEDTLNLNNWRANNCCIWLYLRMSIYYQLTATLGIFEPQEEKKKSSFCHRLKNIFNEAIAATIQNVTHSGKKYDAIVFEHSRVSIMPNLEKGDIYSYHYRQVLKNEGKAVLSVREKLLGIEDSTNDSISLFWISVKTVVYEKLVLLFKLQRFSKSELKTIHLIEHYIKEKFGVDVALKDMMLKYSIRYKFRQSQFKNLIKKSGVNEVKIVAPYDRKSDFVEAAKLCKIKVDELQHGVVSKYHLGYSYGSGEVNCDLLPNRLFLWSAFWNLGALFPKCCLTPKVINHYPFSHSLQSAKEKSVKPKQITIVSQGALTVPISAFIINNSELFQYFSIKYKLHPFEFGRVDEFNSLSALARWENVEIIERCDLLSLLASSEYIIGVFSTVLLEAKEINPDAKVVILDLPGSEYFESSEGFLSQSEFLNLIDIS